MESRKGLIPHHLGGIRVGAKSLFWRSLNLGHSHPKQRDKISEQMHWCFTVWNGKVEQPWQVFWHLPIHPLTFPKRTHPGVWSIFPNWALLERCSNPINWTLPKFWAFCYWLVFFKPTVFTQLFERTMIAGLEIMGIFFMCFLCHIVYKWICESSVSGLKMLRNASSIMGIWRRPSKCLIKGLLSTMIS